MVPATTPPLFQKPLPPPARHRSRRRHRPPATVHAHPPQTLPTFTFRKRSRTVLDTAEEAYLRLDIACGSPSCALCAPTLPALAPAPAHLLLPDAAVLAECLEVFELPQLENVVLLSSVVRQVRPQPATLLRLSTPPHTHTRHPPPMQLHRGGSMRRDARLRALYADRRRRNVLFDDLHHQQTAPRSLSEQRAGLALLAAAEWCDRGWATAAGSAPAWLRRARVRCGVGAPTQSCGCSLCENGDALLPQVPRAPGQQPVGGGGLRRAGATVWQWFGWRRHARPAAAQAAAPAARNE